LGHAMIWIFMHWVCSIQHILSGSKCPFKLKPVIDGKYSVLFLASTVCMQVVKSRILTRSVTVDC
jgi:hypothetical protein